MAHDAKFDTNDERLLDIWDEIQRVQTDFCFAQELSAYYMSPSWLSRTSTVLDVGTGNGYFLSKLRERFPENTYLGVDVSSEFVHRARSTLGHLPGLQFAVQDFFAVTGMFDFVIMRLFWQHLPLARIDEALSRLAAITTIGSSVLITDAHDDVRCFVPDLPELRRIIASYTRKQAESGRSRLIAKTLADRLRQEYRWHVGCDIQLIIPSTIPGHQTLYDRIYGLWIALFEHLDQAASEFEPAKRELGAWIRNDRRFTQAGLHIIRLDRRAT